ncbi:MAG: hypothetical protein IAC61_06165 [Firmicutes bacterium]|uniref:SipW-cognate class signal peptide n=1 Tax=Candidatus Alloenteromonas pullistercoris TaxID=2840785 RepID=A0A9D9GW47_9FIRM|nr:hypothetical protein [Candidatus Enteromonas pullistercoris]
MKTKSKLLVALSALTVGTVAAGATATYAWFTTSRSASASISNITAKNPNGSLAISIGNPKGINEATGNGTASATANFGSAPLIDLSSKDGTYFYSDYVSSGNSSFSDDNTPDGYVAYNGDTGFVQFSLTITNTAESGIGSLDVYLDPENTRINPVQSDDSEDKAMADWIRVAIAKQASATGTHAMTDLTSAGNLVFMNNDNLSDVDDKYVDDAGTLATYSEPDAENFYSTIATIPSIEDQDGKGVEANTTDVSTYVGTIKGGESIYLTCAIWLEGTCAISDAANGGLVNVVLGFTGLDTYVGA